MKVRITLSLDVDVEPESIDEEDGEMTAGDVLSAADCLVTVVGLASSDGVRTDRVHVDGFGETKVTYDLGDLQFQGAETLAEET